MKKKVWFMNHYATNMYFNEGGRHYWFAQNLIKRGYDPAIFCANVRHNTNDSIDIKDGVYTMDTKDGIPFVFVKTPNYKGNGRSRIINMISFYRNLFPTTKQYANKYGKPDIILASSVHPLTLVAGIKIAKIFNIPCICEVRDLWPESLIAYGALKRNSIITRILYQGEKWIYKKADNIIFTMEGGKDYIFDKGWEKDIDISKVYHINNGTDLNVFKYNEQYYKIKDEDLDDSNTFKVIYSGSIRRVNKVEMLVDVAKILKGKNVKILVWGDGDQFEPIQERLKNENIRNMVLKGRVDKKYIPYISSKADLNIISGINNPLYKYGASLNKMFDYFASGKPILSTKSYGYSLIQRYNAGIELTEANPQKIAKSILYFETLKDEDYNEYCINARRAALDYDFKILTDELIKIINI